MNNLVELVNALNGAQKEFYKKFGVNDIISNYSRRQSNKTHINPKTRAVRPTFKFFFICAAGINSSTEI